jgi:hypothetical protein
MSRIRWSIGVLLLLTTCGVCVAQEGEDANVEASVEAISKTFQDPAVPLIALPTTFASRRAKSEIRRLSNDGFGEVANIKGPGCIRHIWLYTDNQKMSNTLILEITVDGAEKPQVVAPLNAFFGIMQDRDSYYVNCSAFTVLPNPVAHEKDPRKIDEDEKIPGTPGYNLFLPIPFSKSCSISVRGQKETFLGTVIDWHKYDENTALTPYRLHVTHKRYKTTPTIKRETVIKEGNPTTIKRVSTIEMANVTGRGFLAGFVTGYIQKDFSDMVFHTGGIKIVLDEKTDPYTIYGNNVEDDYGFSWGFNDYQTRWIGCPTHENRSRNDMDGVFYRFFGPDPIAFRSSVSFTAGCRGDDMETVVYYYKMSVSNSPEAMTGSE